MGSSNVCPTEEAVQALLDYLVDPMLPTKSLSRDTPSQMQLQSVSKQVHAVLLLYNYYNRRQHPWLEYLDFDAFCKLAVILKPSLLAHMKLMQGSDDTEFDDLEKQLSLTEKAIMEACDICTCLDASMDIPNFVGWPISKVSVLLIDSRKQNCFLLFSSITQGVWSIIEKDLDFSNQHLNGKGEETHIKKRKVIIRKPLRDVSNVDEATMQQLAFSAVKDATGINQTDLDVLESHVVYSLGKEKSAARFYIMQCTHTMYQDIISVPIKDVMNSLQGPLVRKSTSRWTITPVVEYFHVLPYARILLDWIHREGFLSSFQEGRVGEVDASHYYLEGMEESKNPVCAKSQDGSLVNGCMIKGFRKGMNSNVESPKLKDDKQCSIIRSSDVFNGAHNVDMDVSYSGLAKEKQKSIPNSIYVGNQQEITIACMNSDSNRSASGCKDDMVTKKSCITAGGAENVASGNDIDKIFEDCNNALVINQSNSKYFEKLQATIASKDNKLSQTALRALIQKRDKLSLQQRMIEDEIAQCEKNIQTILNGGEDDLALKIETIIEGCNDACLKSITEERTYRYFEDQCSPQYLRRKRLSEAILNIQNPCKELDAVCHENNWILPTYHVSPLDGLFRATVIVKGVDFECSSESELRYNPSDARKSAAVKMLARLRSMAKPAQQICTSFVCDDMIDG